MKNENTDIIETCVVFSTDVTINIKVKKNTTYGNLHPEYKIVEVAGIITDDSIDVVNIGLFGRIKEKALSAIIKYQDEL